MTDHVQVDTPSLERFAGRSADRERDFTTLRGQMDSVHLDRGAFGYIPGIGEKIYNAYQEFVDGCEFTTTSMASAMGWLALGVRGTAQAYDAGDQGAADRVTGAGGHR
ncbi:hypothetical protein [Actinoplanes subtropicus]|uniref:hypothetical protein n=1 Tax=Actinoplanes subtropicus TaxID=543632 RepID=UPI0004C31AE4|nr:hypothetical protein [Actinoplanes subtropicus]